MSAHVGDASSSSSEDEGENQRLMDAVWEHNSRDGVQGRIFETNEARSKTSAGEIISSKVKKPSVREMIYHDAPEQFGEDYKSLKTTPEFRSYLAKKLSSVLDEQLKMTKSKKERIFDDDKSRRNEEDTLRLFSSSCCAPDLNPCEPEPPKKRKRPRLGRNTKKLNNNIDDDSDSDVQEQRLLEAAVSGHDVLSFSALASYDHKPQEGQNSSSDSDHTDSHIADDPIETRTALKQSERGDGSFSDINVKKKKRGKKKMDTSRIHADDTTGTASKQTENGDDECSYANVEKKKKRKKTNTIDGHGDDKTRTAIKQGEHGDGQFSHGNVENVERTKTDSADTSEFHEDNTEDAKRMNCFAEIVRSSELSKKTDAHDLSVEIGRKKKKKKKKRMDTSTSNNNDP
ncbi:protein CUSTOS-like isoform X2 [Lytechinus variegatus]|uniref:protein CUSTOS-like isoform X2 n=1 Tax=Lytechinus variegatus TaxID=7654 RepID=UPI001BB135EE|nr:protein CUSTOS-like isoform X2 [Lytechinus variegatus]